MAATRQTIFGFVAAVLFLVACGLFAFFRVVSKRPEPAAAEVVPASWEASRSAGPPDRGGLTRQRDSICSNVQSHRPLSPRQ